MKPHFVRMATRWLAVALLLVAVSSCTGVASETPAQGNVDDLKAGMEKAGFVVAEGVFEAFDIVKMYDAGLITSCWGNNPSTPYMVYKLPLAPGQTVPNMMTEGVINPEREGLWNDFRLRADEAIVFIGLTPPEVDYFSYRSYLGVRYFPAEGKARRVFASLGDTINHLEIKTAGTPDGAKGNPFGQETIIITTADKGTDTRVRAAIQAARYPLSIVNTDTIPAGLVKMGLDAQADNFVFIHRVAFFKDPAAGQKYLSQPIGRVFRVTPAALSTPDPFPVQPLKVRGTGDTSELNLMAAVDELRQAILTKHGSANARELGTRIWLLEGNDAIQRGVDVIGENRDTIYLCSDSFTLADKADEYLIVYGVNHAASGKAIYSNFGMYGEKAINGVGAIASETLAGTAEAYLPNNPAAKYLYVYKVARNARGDPLCLEVKYGVGAAGVDLDQEAFIGFRAYVEPSTRVGPNWFEVLYDRVIKFSAIE
ncbi:MAG: hypothetical protein WCP58_08490 [bacterium]